MTQVYDLYRDIKATSWPAVTGALYLRISPTMPPVEPYSGDRVMGPLLSRDLDYSFTIDNVQYSSTNKSFGLTYSENFELSSPANDKARQIVKVYFNPTDPNESVLIPGPKVLNICLLTLGAIATFWLLKYIITTN